MRPENAKGDLEQFWSLEEIGIRDQPYQDEYERALQTFPLPVQKADDRDEVTLPDNEKKPDLPTPEKKSASRYLSEDEIQGNQIVQDGDFPA